MKRVQRTLTNEESAALRAELERRVPESRDPIGALLRDMRLAAQMSQEEYAQVCQVALRVLTQIENGAGNPRLDTLDRLLKPFGFRMGIVREAQRTEELMAERPIQNQAPEKLSVAFAYVDESGAKGFVRRLDETRDDEIAVYAAIVIPEKHAAYVHERLEPYFESFKRVAPEGQKLHIAAAFNPEFPAWAEVAVHARREIFEALLDFQPKVIYSARRTIVSRRARDSRGAIFGQPRQRRVDATLDTERIEGEAFAHLLEKLDAFGKDFSHQVVPLLDRLDVPIAKFFQRNSVRSRSRTNSTTDFKVPNPLLKASEPLQMHIRISYSKQAGRDANFDMNSTLVADLQMLDFVCAESFATDLVANSLWDHMKSLPDSEPLNGPKAVQGWALAPLVWGAFERDLFDVL